MDYPLIQKKAKESWNAHPNYIIIGVFAVLVLLFYGNTLFNGFVLDDKPIIDGNPYIQSLAYAPKVFTGCIWEASLGGCEGRTLHYRPLHNLTYLLTWQISSEPWFFHSVQLVYLLIMVFLVFSFVRLLAGNALVAFLSALFFLIHPINTEVISWVSTVTDLIFMIFVLLTLISYVKYRRGGGARYFWQTLIFYFLSMLSKEPATIIVPGLILSLDVFIFRMRLGELFSKQQLKRYITIGVPFAVYFAMRMAVLGGFGGLTSQESYLGGFSLAERIYTFFALFAYHFRQLVYPSLVFFHDFQIRESLVHPIFLLSFLVFAIFSASVYILYKKQVNLQAFALSWIAIAFFPMLLFFNIAGRNVFAERYLLVSSVGFALLLSSLLYPLWERKRMFSQKQLRSFKRIPIEPLLLWLQPRARRRGIVVALVGILVTTSWLLVFPRTFDWRSNVALFEKTLSQNPNAHQIREYFADDFQQEGKFEEAKVQYEEIVARDSSYEGIDHVYNNLGEYYRRIGENEKAEEYYKKSIDANSTSNYRNYNNLGAFYIAQGEFLKGLTSVCKAIQIDQTALEPQNNYNRIVSAIQSVSDETFIFLYTDVLQGGAFQPSSEEVITFKNSKCVYGSCFYTFSLQGESGEILFPFLIMADAFPQELIKIQQAEFNPITSEIMLAVDETYKGKLLTFHFPVCSGVRYEVQVAPS